MTGDGPGRAKFHDREVPDIFMYYRLFAAACVILAAPAAPAAGEDGIPWTKDLDAALKQAAQQDKLIFMDIYADWCGPCKMMNKHTFSDAAVRERLAGFVPLKVDADTDVKVAARYGTGALPTLAVLNPEGKLLMRTTGFRGPEQFAAWLEGAEGKRKELQQLQAAVEAAPDNVERAVELAMNYLVLERAEEAHALLAPHWEDGAEELPRKQRAEVMYALAFARVMTERYQSGIALFEQFLEAFPEHARADVAAQALEQAQRLAKRAGAQE